MVAYRVDAYVPECLVAILVHVSPQFLYSSLEYLGSIIQKISP